MIRKCPTRAGDLLTVSLLLVERLVLAEPLH